MDVMTWSNCCMKNVERSSSGAASTKHHRAGALLGTSAVQLFSENHRWKYVFNQYIFVANNVVVMSRQALPFQPLWGEPGFSISRCEISMEFPIDAIESIELHPWCSPTSLKWSSGDAVCKWSPLSTNAARTGRDWPSWKLTGHKLPFPNGVQGCPGCKHSTSKASKSERQYNHTIHQSNIIKWSSYTSGVKHLQATS